MGEIVYRSEVHIEREEGPLRYARLPAREDRIAFGVHSDVAEHYGLTEGGFDAHTTTLDYVVAAAGG